MSKSKGNIINPDDIIERYGADSLRLYEMFMGPLEAMKPWNTKNILGVRRFLERVWRLQHSADPVEDSLEVLLHQTIKKVGEDIESLKMNTAVSSLMILINALEKLPSVPRDAYKTFLQLLYPLAPHIASELWEKLGESTFIYESAWPEADKSKLISTTVPVAVQVNGKVRATIDIPTGVGEKEALTLARAEPRAAKWLALGKEVKAVYVPGKIISFVVQRV